MLQFGSLNFYHPEDIKNFPEYQWRVEGIFPMTGTAMIFGESRVGKSFLALDLAVKIAHGDTWFGYDVKQSGVIYVAAEGPSGIKNRIAAIEDFTEKELPTNLVVMRDPLDLMDDFVIDSLIEAVTDIGQVIIIDTFNAAVPGIDENAVRDMGLVLKSVRRIVSESECLLIFVYHCGHTAQDRPRGHSSLQAAIDTRVLVTKKSRAARWHVVAQREAEGSVLHEFSLQPRLVTNGRSCIVIPGERTKMGAEPTLSGKNRQMVFDIIKKLSDDAEPKPITFDELMIHASTAISTSQKHAKQRLREALDGLCKSGQIVCNPDQSYLIA